MSRRILLRVGRVLEDLSQESLGARSGVSQSVISGVECGRLIPKADELARLAAVLGVWPPEDLLKEVTVVVKRGDEVPV